MTNTEYAHDGCPKYELARPVPQTPKLPLWKHETEIVEQYSCRSTQSVSPPAETLRAIRTVAWALKGCRRRVNDGPRLLLQAVNVSHNRDLRTAIALAPTETSRIIHTVLTLCPQPCRIVHASLTPCQFLTSGV
jgi:hypothetical protein